MTAYFRPTFWAGRRCGKYFLQCPSGFYAVCSAMRFYIPGFFNPEGWQMVAGGRSGARTPGWQSGEWVHPGGMPEFCDPFGVGRRLFDRRPGVSLPPLLRYGESLDPRLLSGKLSACPGSDREPNRTSRFRSGQVRVPSEKWFPTINFYRPFQSQILQVDLGKEKGLLPEEI